MRASGVVACVVVLLGGGCALVSSGTMQDVTINSNPQGAQVVVNGLARATTPARVSLRRSKRTNVVLRKEGYVDRSVPLGTRLNPAFWGNIILGGTIGSTTDFACDSTVEFSPNTYYVPLDRKTSDATTPPVTPQEARARSLVRYILVNYTELMVDVARERGDYLQGLASMTGWADLHLLAGKLRELHARHAEPTRFAEAAALLIDERTVANASSLDRSSD